MLPIISASIPKIIINNRTCPREAVLCSVSRWLENRSNRFRLISAQIVENRSTNSLKRTDSNERFHYESDVGVAIVQSVASREGEREKEREEGDELRLSTDTIIIASLTDPLPQDTDVRASCLCHIMCSSSYVAVNVFWDAVLSQQGQRYTAKASSCGVSSWRSVSLLLPFSLIITDTWRLYDGLLWTSGAVIRWMKVASL